jgi:hypothetical protein
MWIKDGIVYKLHSEIRKASTLVGFPPVITDEMLAEHGFVKVIDPGPPASNDATEIVIEQPPEQVDGEWRKAYLKRTLTQEEFQERRQERARDKRERRDRLLSESDWTQLLDTPGAVQAEWAAYRVLLRDLTKQPGWPFNVDWPVKP